MESFQRAQVDTLVERLAEPPRHIIALFGPRQTGKTTIARQALARTDLPSRYLAVDEPDPAAPPFPYDETAVTLPAISQRQRDTQWLVRQWEAARTAAERSPGGSVLVLDEVQKIPDWSETLKGLWDADRLRDCPLHVVILGSAPLLMQSGLSESLAGRFETIRVSHWSFAEMSEAFGFDLPQYLYFGGYPGAAPLVRDPDRWRGYILGGLVEPNIERDLLAMTRVDKPALLKRLFELGADSSGQILSYTKMLGQLHGAGNTTTLARYVDLLAKVGLLAGLQKYSGGPVSSRGSIPKLNVLNTALMTAGSAYSFEEARADRTYWGRIVESAVGAHLFNTAESDMRLHYWREGQHEVDFVLKRGRRVVAVEVKSGEEGRPARGRRPLRGMEEFERRFDSCRGLLVGEGGVPINELLTAPAGEWFEEAWA
ncbi:MAG: ATP-binding protein [Gemmatimonadaceae bacterium]|nr:ATP-binding protein [Gemmatimonadaceae bacterium]